MRWAYERLHPSSLALLVGPLAVLLFAQELRGSIADPSFGIDVLVFRSAAINFLHHQAPYVIYPPAGPFFYPPSSLLFFSPLSLLGPRATTLAWLAVQVAAVLTACALILHMYGLRWWAEPGAVVLLGLALFAPLLANFDYSNINGLLLLAEAGFIVAAARRRWWLAGSILGVTLAVKPAFIGLLLVPIVFRGWRALLPAIAIPSVLSVATLAVMAGRAAFFHVFVSYLTSGEAHLSPQVEPFNVTLAGALDGTHLPIAANVGLRAAVFGAVLILIWVRARDAVDIRVRVTEVTGLVVLATLLCTNFAWYSYTIWLLPLLLTVVHRESLMRSLIAWSGVYLFASPLSSTTPLQGVDFGTHRLRFTAGYAVLLVALAFSLVGQHMRKNKLTAGRADDRVSLGSP